MKVEKRRAFIINFTYFLILAALALFLLKYAFSLLSPFVLGFFFAWLLQRPIRFLSRSLRLGRKLTAVLATAAFYATIGLLIALLGIKAVSGLRSFVQFLPQLYDTHIGPIVADVFSGLEGLAIQMDTSMFALISEWEARMIQSLSEAVSSLSVEAMGTISGIAVFLPGLVLKLILMVISTFFIAADYDKLVGVCADRMGGSAAALFLQVRNYLIGTLFVCIRSYMIIMSITFVELAIALSLIGLEHAVLIALLTAVLDILPVLGTGAVMIPWSVIAAMSGRYTLALRLIVIYLIITVVRNILEPKIVGGQLGLHPVVTLASMFAGVQLFGVAGLFGFPIGLSLLRYLNDNGTLRLFRGTGEGGAFGGG